MSNFELPNEKQLEQLRESGLSPYSSFLTASFIAVVVFLCVFFCFDYFISFFHELNSFDDIIRNGNFIISLLLLPPVAVLVFSLIFILIQRKFYVRFSFLYPLSREKLKFSIYYRFIFVLSKNLFLVVFASGTAVAVFYYLFPFFFEILTKSSEDNIVIFLLALKSFLPIFIVIELGLFLFWFLIYKLLFLFSLIMNKNKVLDK